MNTYTLRPQVWGDNLRLPTFMNAAGELRPLMEALEPYHRPHHPFQSKQLPSLKRDLWYVLKRPEDRSRTGLLCIWPAGNCCIFVGHKKTVLLRLRIDPTLLTADAGLTVFAATLSSRDRALTIEDTILWRGAPAQDKSFTERFTQANQWLEHYCIADPRLLGGVQVKMAAWGPLDTILRAERGAEPGGVWDFQPNDARRPRLLWISNAKGPSIPSTPVMNAAIPAPVEPISLVLDSSGPLVAQAKKETGPEQWSLWSSDGVSLGRALIRRLEIGASLRSVATTSPVEVAWSPTFNKWEIVAISLAAPKPQGFFVVPK
jgi:hypothetical protein